MLAYASVCIAIGNQRFRDSKTQKGDRMFRQFAMSLAAVMALAVSSLASAKTLRSAEPEELPLNQATVIVAPETVLKVSPVPANCCPQRCITYKHHGRSKCCLPPIETILAVKDPCVCDCFIEVPLCIPGCCTTPPEMRCKTGLFGRQIVEYKWCCGYRVKIIFDRHGDLIVHTFSK